MPIWEADFYRRPLQDEQGHPLWELLLCDRTRTWEFSALCPQPDANATWVVAQLKKAAESQSSPERLQVFRPQALGLLELAGKELGIAVEPTRRTFALKQLLREKAQQYSNPSNYGQQPYSPLELDKPPPTPIAENIQGEQWRFAAIAAGQLVAAFQDRPIPILEMPETLLPLSLGLASDLPVPGVIIDAGRRSMKLAQWLQQVRPVALNYMAGSPDGLILEAGLADRWVLATFEDPGVKTAAQAYEQRKQASQGLHFLLVQPDDSGMTYSGFWLLQPVD
ncbi:MAG TPA: Tab2/Atab2 family RNA-binding protein [Candidatus Obscuribacterales bacterium]